MVKNPKEYIMKIIITIFFYILSSLCLSSVNRIGYYIIYFTPIMIIPLIIQVYLDYNDKLTTKKQLLCQKMTLITTTIICLPIFLGVYFGIFHPIQSLSLHEIQNCQVTGIAKMSQPSFEVYSILYVDFQYDSQQFLGYACMSDKPQNLSQYSFKFKGDIIEKDVVGESYNIPKSSTNNLRILHNNKKYKEQKQQQYQQEQLFLREQDNQNSQSEQKIKKNRRRLRDRISSYSRNGSTYNFSNVKLPSWMCLSEKISFDELSKVQKCYVNFYNSETSAYNNSKNRLNLKQQSNFALTLFHQIPFFPKTEYFCLIIFTYLPNLISFYPLSSFIVKYLISINMSSQYKIF